MITGKQFGDAIISAAHNICRQKKSIDALNVFPVPDGDTGTNMAMTISAAIEVLNEMNIDDNTGIDEVASAIASALLRGARGNSGVILSQLFRGFSNACRGKSSLDSADFASALASGVDAAYRAVLKPTEGTVLTVSRMAAEAATIATTSESFCLS